MCTSTLSLVGVSFGSMVLKRRYQTRYDGLLRHQSDWVLRVRPRTGECCIPSCKEVKACLDRSIDCLCIHEGQLLAVNT